MHAGSMPIEDIKRAVLDWCANSETGRFAPRAADIVQMLQGDEGRGTAQSALRLEGNEAWSVALCARSEAQSVACPLRRNISIR